MRSSFRFPTRWSSFARARFPRFLCPLTLLLSPLAANGQDYELIKLAASGEDVPGDTAVTERFAYFGGVHIFEDGQVGFNATTTRTGSFFRSAPRGIYLSTKEGIHTVIAEINDEDAWRSIGLPHRLMDSDSSKTFAFDYLNPTDDGLFPVLARKEIGQGLQALNPDDGSLMEVSGANLPAGESHEGNFGFIYGGTTINATGDIMVNADFMFADDPENQKNGLFVATPNQGIRNVVFEGDEAPFVPNATFSQLSFPVLADNGNVFFTSSLTGTGVTSIDNQALWMEDDGDFTIVLREGDDAPLLPGKQIRLTGVNMLPIGYRGDHLVLFAGASAPGGALRRVFWHANSAGSAMRPIVHYYSSPLLTVEDYFTPTDGQPVAFTSVDGNTILMNDRGDVYFHGGGKLANGNSIGGIWRYEHVTGSLALVVQSLFGAENVSVQNLLAVNESGCLAFIGRKNNIRGIYMASPTGSLSNIINVGDKIGERTITGFASHSATESGATLANHKKASVLNQNGDLVFVAEFADDPNDADNHRDEAIMLAAVVPPGDQFLWSGDAGDDDWHKVLNWDAEETGEDADRVPGTVEHTDIAIIRDSSVAITNGDVHLGSLFADGSLTVERSLRVDDESEATDLSLRADLTTNATLTLSGTSEWSGGRMDGDGEVLVPAEASLEISPTLGESNLHTILRVEGEASQGSSALNLVGERGKVEVLFGGSYDVTTGSIVDDTQGVHFFNEGTFWKASDGEFLFDAFFENARSGSVDVDAGTLRFIDPSTWNGELRLQPGARVEFHNTQVNLGDAQGGAFAALGYGQIKITDSFVHISGDSENIFQMLDDTGRFEITGTTEVTGEGTLINGGNAVFGGVLISAPLVNEASSTSPRARWMETPRTTESSPLPEIDWKGKSPIPKTFCSPRARSQDHSRIPEVARSTRQREEAPSHWAAWQ